MNVKHFQRVVLNLIVRTKYIKTNTATNDSNALNFKRKNFYDSFDPM